MEYSNKALQKKHRWKKKKHQKKPVCSRHTLSPVTGAVVTTVYFWELTHYFHYPGSKAHITQSDYKHYQCMVKPTVVMFWGGNQQLFLQHKGIVHERCFRLDCEHFNTQYLLLPCPPPCPPIFQCFPYTLCMWYKNKGTCTFYVLLDRTLSD